MESFIGHPSITPLLPPINYLPIETSGVEWPSSVSCQIGELSMFLFVTFEYELLASTCLSTTFLNRTHRITCLRAYKQENRVSLTRLLHRLLVGHVYKCANYLRTRRAINGIVKLKSNGFSLNPNFNSVIAHLCKTWLTTRRSPHCKRHMFLWNSCLKSIEQVKYQAVYALVCNGGNLRW